MQCSGLFVQIVMLRGSVKVLQQADVSHTNTSTGDSLAIERRPHNILVLSVIKQLF